MATTERTNMETLHQAIDRLEGQGYEASVRALPEGRLVMRRPGGEAEPSRPAEAFTVEDVVRFEGASDPGDESVVFALRSPDGARGLFVATYGPQMEAECVAVVERLDADPAHRDSER